MIELSDPSALELARHVRPGDRVMWGQGGSEATALTAALIAERHAIGRVRSFFGVTWSEHFRPEYADCIEFTAYCAAGHNRKLAEAGVLDIVPSHYSQLGAQIRGGALKADVLLLQLAERDGEFSLAMSNEFLIPALETARVVIGEVNAQAPFTAGERSLKAADLACILRTDRAPLEAKAVAPSAVEAAIARHVADWIGDGATLELGLGSLPEAILGQLADRRDLGVHSGAIGDKVAELMERGVITNARKSIDPGVTTAGVLLGGARLNRFAHGNPAIRLRSSDYTHGAAVLASIDNFIAINSAIEVDLTGQINSEVAAGRYLGAVGGAADFARGAVHSKGGVPIFALGATAGRASRIVSRLSGPVTVSRADAGIIATEYGAADLRGLSLNARIPKMIAIAHPDHRERLEREAHALRAWMPAD